MRRRNPINRGRWALERERHGLDRENPLPPEHSTTVGAVVPLIMKQMGLQERFWEQALIGEWEGMVGPQVAKNARPGRLDRKILHVFVSHPAWLSELSRYGQKQILAKLQARFGADKIKGLRLQLDPDSTK